MLKKIGNDLKSLPIFLLFAQSKTMIPSPWLSGMNHLLFRQLQSIGSSESAAWSDSSPVAQSKTMIPSPWLIFFSWGEGGKFVVFFDKEELDGSTCTTSVFFNNDFNDVIVLRRFCHASFIFAAFTLIIIIAV